MAGPSNAWKSFTANADDIKRLLEIHSALGGSGPGRRHRLEVLNKSAIVLITAIWEAYCEDIASEALEHLVANIDLGAKLPTELRKRIAKELKESKHELALWDVADDGWKQVARGRLATITAERNRKFNTPKSASIDELFEAAIGLQNLSSAWKWHRMTPERARAKLDKYIELRGSIAHRGKSATSCKKSQVEDYFQHVRWLASRTGGRVRTFVRRATGKKIF